MSNAEKRVTEGPSAQDWLAIRPIFKRLYLNENQTLNEVRKKLAAHYNFFATEKACKRRIKLWQLRKNYKAAEKQQLASYEDAMLSAGDLVPALNIDGKPVKWNRVYRHKRDCARLQRQTDRLWQALQRLADNRALQTRYHDVSETFLGVCKEFWASEIALQTNQEYLGNLKNLWIDWEFTRKFDSAAVLLSTNAPQQSQRGWGLIHQGCKALPKIISTEPLTVLKLALNLCHPRWNKFAEVPDHLILLIRNISFKTLVPDNPFRNVMMHVTSADFLHTVLSPLLMLQFDILCKASTTSEQSLMILTNSVVGLLTWGEFSAAQQRLAQISQILNVSGWSTVYISYLAAMTQCKMKEYKAAERECQSGLAMTNEFRGERWTLRAQALFHTVLSICYDAADDEDRGTQHRWLAFAVALDYYGKSDTELIELGAALVRCLRKQQRWIDLEAIRLQCPEAFLLD